MVSKIKSSGEQGIKEIDWSLLEILASGGLAAGAAVLVWLCWMYWPVLAPLLSKTAHFVLGLITKLGNLLKGRLPNFTVDVLGMVGLKVHLHLHA